MKVAIHQPNYLPWLGFFHKLLAADTFVILDTVQFPRGKNFISRTAIKTPQGAEWLTIPIPNKSSLLPIKEISLPDNLLWVKKHLRSLAANYRRAEYFAAYYPCLERFYSQPGTGLADFNISLINQLADWLGAQTKIVRASQLPHEPANDGLERLLNICQAVGASAYITGQGAGSLRYMSEPAFTSRGIRVIWQQFQHPSFSQLWGEFIPNLSVLDLLFNHGPAATSMLTSKEG